MHDYVKAMTDIQARFKSGNSVPVERAMIKASEFEAVKAELNRLQSLCHFHYNNHGAAGLKGEG